MDKLNEAQKAVYDACISTTNNIFCTGSGGTGKSFLLRSIVDELNKDGDKSKSTSVVAPTGMAALLVRGTTIHSFAGVQIIEDNKEEMLKRARRGMSYGNWMDTETIIFDEVSMVSATFFDNLSYVACQIRGSDKPFGGMRLIMFGDFLQLPPISKKGHRAKKVFQSNTWKRMEVRTYLLIEIVRQSDPEFKSLLSRIRLGTINSTDMSTLTAMSRDLTIEGGMEAVKLYPRRATVESYNTDKLSELASKSYEFKCIDRGNKKNLENCIAPEKLVLKVGAQVMVTRNLVAGVVNGSLGKVLAFMYCDTDKTMKPVVSVLKDDGSHYTHTMDLCVWDAVGSDGRTVVASRKQMPLILAWATTIHKSQGQSIPLLEVDLSGVFECGQAYVALSRATSSTGLRILGITKGNVRADPDSIDFYTKLQCAVDEDSLHGYNGVVIKEKSLPKIHVGFAD